MFDYQTTIKSKNTFRSCTSGSNKVDFTVVSHYQTLELAKTFNISIASLLNAATASCSNVIFNCKRFSSSDLKF